MKTIYAMLTDRTRLYSFFGGIALIALAVLPQMMPQTALKAARYDELVALRDRACTEAAAEGARHTFVMASRMENGQQMRYLGCDVIGTHVVTWWKKASSASVP